jgi:hypothetical protein
MGCQPGSQGYPIDRSLRRVNPANKPVKKAKLGASPQLECWNAGILEKWVLTYGPERILDYWVNGNNRLDDKIKNG